MQKKFLVKEVVNHFHTITLDEEISIENLIEQANRMANMYDTGYKAIGEILERYKDKYGFEYDVEANGCGTETLEIELVDEVE